MSMPLARIQQGFQKLDNWALEGATDISKEYTFKDFREAMIFVDKVATIADRHNHHPMIVINYNQVRLSLTTHSEHGLTQKDFEVAEEIDKIGK